MLSNTIVTESTLFYFPYVSMPSVVSRSLGTAESWMVSSVSSIKMHSASWISIRVLCFWTFLTFGATTWVASWILSVKASANGRGFSVVLAGLRESASVCSSK